MAKKVPIEDLPINVWQPMQNGQPCLAMIGNLPMLFRGETPMKARKAATGWIREERSKVALKEENTRKRVEAARAARAARKEETTPQPQET